MIIGLTGGMGVGKSTAVDILREHLRNIEVVKFAAPLYDMQEMIYRRIAQVYARPPEFVKDRKLLQWLGTDWGRDTISKTLWVDIWKAEAALNLAYGNVVICDDVRFDNEADAIKSMGGIIIKITSNNAIQRITTANGITGHASENGISPEKIDFTIANDGLLVQYEKDLMAVIDRPATSKTK